MSFSKRDREILSGFSQYRVPPGLTPKGIKEFLMSLDCPRSLAVWLLYESKEHEQLVDLAFRPEDYCESGSLRDAYMATKFLSKYEDLHLDRDLDEVAFLKFQNMESKCRDTNNRMRYPHVDPLYKGPTVWLHHATKRKIEAILGDFSAEEFFDHPDWGPGASTLLKRKDASPQQKFQSEIGITRDLYNLVSEPILQGFSPAWYAQLKKRGYPHFQVSNKVITVPKDASTNRVIAVEPGINLWFQKSIGEMISKRLLKCGIDLRSQSRNQHLAKLGSKTTELATVDFSSASDTISRGLVQELLPERWFTLMDKARSHYGQIKDRVVLWEKFSSMGNGFTFPLETLIFYAAALACAEYLGTDLPVSAYGDDVILPSSAFELYSELVAYYGFTINPKKSYHLGNFRESCGAHWYSGFDVKPVYFRRQLEHIDDIFRLYNSVRRLAHRQGFSLGCDARFRSTADLLIRSVPKSMRLRIPDGYGDGGFIANFDEATPVRARNFIEGYYFRHYGQTSNTRCFSRAGYLLAELWRLSKRATSLESSSVRPTAWVKATEEITSIFSVKPGRNSVPTHSYKPAFFRSLAKQWPDLGPWTDLGTGHG